MGFLKSLQHMTFNQQQGKGSAEVFQKPILNQASLHCTSMLYLNDNLNQSVLVMSAMLEMFFSGIFVIAKRS